jgi:hypothetical protein
MDAENTHFQQKSRLFGSKSRLFGPKKRLFSWKGTFSVFLPSFRIQPLERFAAVGNIVAAIALLEMDM